MVRFQNMVKKELILGIIRLLRPIHWVKNLAVFSAIFLTGNLYETRLLVNVFWAFVVFCFATSGTYIFNDILDRKNDKLHPTKRFRPIASGIVPIQIAVVLSFGLISIALFLSASLNPLFFFIVGTYLFLQVIYSLGLKNIAVLDILIIASGFIIRVYAGAFAIDAHLSVWFLLTVISVALFLASGKRRAELNLVGEQNSQTRKSLAKYNKPLLDSFVTMFGGASWMSWSLFTFFESPKASLPFWLTLAEISRTTTIDKLLMITIPVTIFGIMRYESLIFEGKSETPERLLLRDASLITAVGLWILVVYWVLYSGVSNV